MRQLAFFYKFGKFGSIIQKGGCNENRVIYTLFVIFSENKK